MFQSFEIRGNVRKYHYRNNFEIFGFSSTHHSGPENIKKSRPKKLVKPNKSMSGKKFFDQIPFFAISKLAKNQFLNWEKV